LDICCIQKDGRRVEHSTIIGSLIDFPTKEGAWKEVDRPGIQASIDSGAGPDLKGLG